MNEVFLVEDHDEVLTIWRRKNFKGLDLIHLDAHIDFGFFIAKPLDKLFNEAKSVKDLKKRLEHTLNFLHYEKDFNKQINIGNYVCPAIEQGLVNNFYWVVPGKSKEFKSSTKTIKGILKHIARLEHNKKVILEEGNGRISTQFLGRELIVCNLDNLPKLNNRVLLDIDVDFLVIDSVLNADNTKNIGKRKPWISPRDLLDLLKQRIKAPEIVTISYSVNGGYTPVKYKHLGDEIAFLFSPEKFRRNFENNSSAALYFNLFYSTNKKEYYQKAIRLNPTYRVADNNYGPLYLSLRKLSLAQKEFLKILAVDPENPACNLGLGNLALERKNFKKAQKYIFKAKNQTMPCNGKILSQSLLGLARAEFGLKNFKRAKELLIRYNTLEPLQPYSYYLLGYIYEKEEKFTKAAGFYKDAIRLGIGSIEPISRLLKISCHLKEKDDIIKYVIEKYKDFKRAFVRAKKLSFKRGKNIKGLQNIEKKLNKIGHRLSRQTEHRTPHTEIKEG